MISEDFKNEDIIWNNDVRLGKVDIRISNDIILE